MAYQIKRTESIIADYTTSKEEYLLPKDPYKGLFLYIMWIQPTGFTVYGNGYKIIRGGDILEKSDSRAGQGDLNIFIFDGSYWHHNYCPR